MNAQKERAGKTRPMSQTLRLSDGSRGLQAVAKHNKPSEAAKSELRHMLQEYGKRMRISTPWIHE